MNGWSYDYMLAIDDVNCPARSKQRETVSQQVKDAQDNAVKAFPAMQQYVQKYGFSQVCDYVRWAWTESIDLKDDITSSVNLDQMYNACSTGFAEVAKVYNNLEGSSLKQVSSNDLRSKLADYTSFWLSKQPGISGEDKKKYEDFLATHAPLRTTAGAENPNYVLFWTNEDLLTLQNFHLTG